jgi:hypothetical protein
MEIKIYCILHLKAIEFFSCHKFRVLSSFFVAFLARN